ncbi:Scr1 family TA system antitoxin-like transcriptional regulator [Streptomyces peucetius]
MKRVEPQITTIRGRLNSFFASASFSSGVSSCGYDTGSSWWCGPRGACGDENEGVQDPVDREEQPSLDGPFTLVTPKGQSQVAYLETHTYPRLITGREEVQVLSVRYGITKSQALRPGESLALIEKMLGER